MQKSTIFLYNSKKQSENEIMKTMSITIVLKKNKVVQNTFNKHAD